MSSETVLLEFDGPVAIVTNNRPDKHNAANNAMDERLWEVLEELHQRDGVRCVGQNVQRFPIRNSGASGVFGETNIASFTGAVPGTTSFFQGWFRDLAGPCSGSFNFSNAVSVAFRP